MISSSKLDSVMRPAMGWMTKPEDYRSKRKLSYLDSQCPTHSRFLVSDCLITMNESSLYKWSNLVPDQLPAKVKMLRQCIITVGIQLSPKAATFNTILWYLTLESNVEISWGWGLSKSWSWGQWESASPSSLLWTDAKTLWKTKQSSFVSRWLWKNAMVITVCMALGFSIVWFWKRCYLRA